MCFLGPQNALFLLHVVFRLDVVCTDFSAFSYTCFLASLPIQSLGLFSEHALVWDVIPKHVISPCLVLQFKLHVFSLQVLSFSRIYLIG